MLEPSPKGLFAKGKVDPSEAGKKGVEERERRRRERLDETRQALEARAREVAERLTDIALGKVKASPTEVSAANAVLDRVVAKAPPPDIDATHPSMVFMELIAQMDAEERSLSHVTPGLPSKGALSGEPVLAGWH
jgi:hypothetical protein